MNKSVILTIGFVLMFFNAMVADGMDSLVWPGNLPVYDHIVIVIEENKDYEEVIGQDYAPYINNVLKKEGANFTKIYGEEHFSQGNYFWLFSGDNQNVGFSDEVPDETNPSYPFTASNLGFQLIKKGLSFKGYSESLPAIGSKVERQGNYARKHVPWISFKNVPNGITVETSSNLRFKDFPPPSGYNKLPTVSFVIPNLDNDMHNCYKPKCNLYTPAENLKCCIKKGDDWLRENIDSYYQWAKNNNSLLILTFDENDDKRGYQGLTNPMIATEKEFCDSSKIDPEYCEDLENRIVTIFAGAHIKSGDYPEGKGITHVNILRTLEAMYGLPKSGKQQPNAAGFGISDDYIITDIFEIVR
ncbi:MAG: alkaline phosphatase family protein [Thermodesulfobacteriota bacterium]|nr:alkaline phosphatase family protein [Thermodesulfobacteriota bacterium]